jgi:uncharacterized membrane protein YhhN
MFKRFKFFNIFYLFIIIINIIVLYYIKDYRMVAKPMIMGSLIGFYIGHIEKQSPVFIMGMVFALMGDIFLMFDNEIFFIIGIACFLLMQILYVVTFFKDKDNGWKTKWTYITAIYGLSIILFFLMAQNAGSLTWPVLIYTLAIATMANAAVVRKSSTIWYREVVIGAFLFMVSDAWLGMSKFGVLASSIDGTIVMITYMIAQYLIVRGIVERDLPLEKARN